MDPGSLCTRSSYFLSHIDCFAEDLCVLPQEGRAGQEGRGLHSAVLWRAFPLTLLPQGSAPLPCPYPSRVLWNQRRPCGEPVPGAQQIVGDCQASSLQALVPAGVSLTPQSQERERNLTW